MKSPNLDTAELAFFVVPGERTAAEIVAALGVTGKSVEPQYRDVAVSPWLHTPWNQGVLCVLRAAGHTIVAPPGSQLLQGDPRWAAALSRAFGACFAFCATSTSPSVLRYENGERTAEASDAENRPPEGLLGVCSPRHAGDVLGGLARLLGVSMAALFEGSMDELDVVTVEVD